METKKFIEAIEAMTVLELNELVEAIQEKFGVTAAAPVAAAGAQGAAKAEEPSEVNLYLKEFGGNKIAVIKVIREIMGSGLMEAKQFVENPTDPVKEKMNPDDAKELGAKLAAAGATFEIK